jgi:flagella basal body P-ring formation protein FlgA
VSGLKIRLSLGALIWLSAAGFLWAATAVVSVAVPPEKVVSGERVRLADVAFIDVLDRAGEQLAAELGQVDLGPAPAPGREVVLRRDQLKKTLLESGLDIRSAAWSFPPELRLSNRDKAVSEDDLRAVLEKYLAETEPYRSGRYQLLNLSLGAVPKLSAEPFSYRFQPQMSSNPVNLSGHFLYTQAGKEAGRQRVTTQVDLKIPVLVAARPLSRGQALTAAEVSPGWAPFAKGQGALTDPAAVIGLTLKSNLGAGEVFFDRLLTKSLLVRRGETVTIMAVQGPLRVTAAGQAREDGAIGDTITVTNLGSKKNVSGRVVGPGQVEVVF